MEHGAGGDDGGNVSKLRDVRDGRFRLERESNGNADEGRGERRGRVSKSVCVRTRPGGGRYVEHVRAKRIDRFEFRRRRRRRRKEGEATVDGRDVP